MGIPKGLSLAIIKIKPAEAMILPLAETKEKTLNLTAYKKIKDFLKNIDVLLIGPGLTQNKSTQGLIRKLILNTDKTTVIDADGINALAGHLGRAKMKKIKTKSIVITPHPGEMAKLTGEGIKEVQANRLEVARKFAHKHKVTVVLKGHKTVVADYKDNLYINGTGNPGMAKAGSGDVLAGIIAAFLGQGLNVFEAAKYAVYLHGLAGDLAAKEKTQLGMIASDIIEKIPAAIKLCS